VTDQRDAAKPALDRSAIKIRNSKRIRLLVSPSNRETAFRPTNGLLNTKLAKVALISQAIFMNILRKLVSEALVSEVILLSISTKRASAASTLAVIFFNISTKKMGWKGFYL
jgi:hypothetical protein